MPTRRHVLSALVAFGALPATGWAAVGNPAYLAAARCPDGSFSLHGLNSAGIETFSIALPARGHAACGHPTRALAVGFARRPGDFAFVIDCANGAVTHRLRPPAGREFNGHGAFSQDGALLFVSEQEAVGSRGHVGVWETETFTRVGSFPTGGIGPHELRLMPDGDTLVIANGGIETRGREKLNLDHMAPSLVYASVQGEILETVTLPTPLQQNSIRHLATRADGLVGFAMQWQGPADDTPPLLGLHRRGSPPILAEAPLAEALAMKGYAGSIAFAGNGSEIAISSPRGSRLHRFDETGRFLGAFNRTDVCGLAGFGDGYLASDGLGALIAVEPDGPRLLTRSNLAWDNHLIAL